MRLDVEIICTDRPRPPAGSPVIVQLQDTTYQDVAAKVIAEARADVRSEGETLARVSVDAPGDRGTVWAHVDVDRDGEVGKGDYITKQSFPSPAGGGLLRVIVSRV